MGVPKNERKRPRAEAEDVTAPLIEDQDIGSGPSSKKAKVEQRRSLFVRSLPPDATSESLADLFSQYFAVKHATVVVDQKTKESRGFGFVTLADADDAAAAKTALDKKEWDGRHIRIDIAEPRHRDAAKGPGTTPPGKPAKQEFERPPKLIIRNLPWSIKTSDQLSGLFRSFGKVKFADLPQSKGKLRGFGFVTIRGKANTEKALAAVNGKEIDGRTVAVDWAVDKQAWDHHQAPQNKDEDHDMDEEVDEEADEDAASESEDDAPSEDGGARTARDEGLDADLESFMKNHMQNLEDEDEDEDEDDEDEDDEDEEDDMAKDKASSKATPKRTTDNSSTVFIRNLPFTTTDEQLKSHFGRFGMVRYARVVVDKATDKPAGTGFVCFVNQEDSKSCIKEAPRPAQSATATKHSILQDEGADPDGKYTLDGRLLQVAQAVNKEQAANLADNSLLERREKDKRKLFLLSEGAIGPGSPLYNLLTEPEIRMRQASAVQRKKMVQKNPSLHLSLTRLALRNIPRDIGSTELKELARKAVVGFAQDVKEGRRQPLSKEENARDGKDAKEKERERKLKGKGIVRQAKVIFESNQGSKVTEKSGAGKSRGYGFIEYTSHHWALMGLRYLNAHQLQGDAGKKQRLVVEFAIENAQVVQRRRAAEAKSREASQPEKQTTTTAKSTKEAQGGRQKGPAARKDKSRKGSKKAPKPVEGEPAAADDDGQMGDGKETMQQKLIVRKRLMRKKKAKARGKS